MKGRWLGELPEWVRERWGELVRWEVGSFWVVLSGLLALVIPYADPANWPKTWIAPILWMVFAAVLTYGVARGKHDAERQRVAIADEIRYRADIEEGVRNREAKQREDRRTEEAIIRAEEAEQRTLRVLDQIIQRLDAIEGTLKRGS